MVQKLISILVAISLISACNSGNDAQSQSDSLETNSNLPSFEDEAINYAANDEDIAIYDSIIKLAKEQKLNGKKFMEALL